MPKKKPKRKPPAAKARTTMVQPKTKAEMLKVLSLFMETSDNARSIWDILAGLRGPDDLVNGPERKSATTEVIRLKALGSAAINGAGGWDYGKDSNNKVAARKRMTFGHFKSHAMAAFDALGLDWDEVNP